MPEPICVVPAGDWTGEGALWHAEESAVYWVDIGRWLIHRFDPASRGVRTWFFNEPVTALGLTDRPDTMIVALGSKLILWQSVNDARADFAKPDGTFPLVRSNDGKPDPAGNFWFGTMRFTGTGEPLGRVFRVTSDGTATVHRTGIHVSNTFAWSPDSARFYNADSDANTLHVWDYDMRTGLIANERPFFDGFDRGVPDGSAVDRDGYLWNARYGGNCVVRVAPDGSIDRILEMPVSAVTTCAFGGPNLKTLYITSGGGERGATTGERFGGGLFTVEVDVPGLPENRFRIGR